jgi:hypothetical protein
MPPGIMYCDYIGLRLWGAHLRRGGCSLPLVSSSSPLLDSPLEDFTSPLQFKIGMEKGRPGGCESIFYSPIHRTFYLSSILNAQATAPQTPRINKERKINARRVIPPRTPNPCPSQSINLFKALNSMLSIQESGRAGEKKERNE